MNYCIKKVGKYIYKDTKEEILGKGSFGIVFKCYNTESGKIFANKIIRYHHSNDEIIKQIKNEAKIMKPISSHPNIVRLYETLKSTNNFYLIMEYCNGGNLEILLKREGYLSIKQSISIVKDILNGYSCLLSRNIAHRDLKLENILIHNDVYKVHNYYFTY